ncbi:hypothetical protein [Streptomyces sp. NPDC088748]|uniref:hypothetical protein n=1 Tax=Streptomyces sp. NPDC088748 TaxID=3365887 RepID=UPI0037FA8121
MTTTGVRKSVARGKARCEADDAALLQQECRRAFYRWVCATRWKMVPREVCKRLRTGWPIRKNKLPTVRGQGRSQIIEGRPIEYQPQAVGGYSEFGHLEDDLVIGSNKSQVVTVVDRKTRLLHVVKFASCRTAVAVLALTEAYARMDIRLHGTLT